MSKLKRYCILWFLFSGFSFHIVTANAGNSPVQASCGDEFPRAPAAMLLNHLPTPPRTPTPIELESPPIITNEIFPIQEVVDTFLERFFPNHLTILNLHEIRAIFQRNIEPANRIVQMIFGQLQVQLGREIDHQRLTPQRVRDMAIRAGQIYQLGHHLGEDQTTIMNAIRQFIFPFAVLPEWWT